MSKRKIISSASANIWKFHYCIGVTRKTTATTSARSQTNTLRKRISSRWINNPKANRWVFRLFPLAEVKEKKTRGFNRQITLSTPTITIVFHSINCFFPIQNQQNDGRDGEKKCINQQQKKRERENIIFTFQPLSFWQMFRLEMETNIAWRRRRKICWKMKLTEYFRVNVSQCFVSIRLLVSEVMREWK